MTRIKHFASALLIVLALGAAPGFAHAQCDQYAAPPLPRWGDYDENHNWRAATWWWMNRADWASAHHPEWWGDFDETHAWRPAAWWWRYRNDWTRAHHPEWWGDYCGQQWYPAAWWWQNYPAWTRLHYHGWWGAPNQGTWYPAGWWWRINPEWSRVNHPEWWGDFNQGRWYPAGWWWQFRPDWARQTIPIGGAGLTGITNGGRPDGVVDRPQLVPRESSRWWGAFDDQQHWQGAASTWWWQRQSHSGRARSSGNGAIHNHHGGIATNGGRQYTHKAWTREHHRIGRATCQHQSHQWHDLNLVGEQESRIHPAAPYPSGRPRRGRRSIASISRTSGRSAAIIRAVDGPRMPGRSGRPWPRDNTSSSGRRWKTSITKTSARRRTSGSRREPLRPGTRTTCES